MATLYLESNGWGIVTTDLDRLEEAMDAYGVGAGELVNEYLADEGCKRIAAHIPDLIHASGRKWKGKTTSATKAPYTSVFFGSIRRQDSTLVVKSNYRYNYLYFPDDGNNTKRHAGMQQFMLQGAEDQAEAITNDLVTRLAAAFEEG